jgi:GH25 family lysozyme M1 (1,4-beta-N-acetylmuramidase)
MSRHLLPLVASLAGLIACGRGVDPISTTTQPVTGQVCATGATVRGFDTSGADPDYGSAVAQGFGFAYAEVSDGLGNPRANFGANWAAMGQAGILRGAYQLFRASEDPIAQANLVVQAVGRLGPNDLPAMFDLELSDGQPASVIVERAHQWIDAVTAGTGKTPFLYTGPYFYQDSVNSPDFAGMALWIADYNPPGGCPVLPDQWSRWTFWQNAGTVAVQGIGAADLDLFNGTLDQLRGLAAGTGTLSGYTGMAATPDGSGYWLVGSDGGVFTYGSAGFFGSLGGKALNAPIAGIAAAPDGRGYWLVGADGGVFAFGSAAFFGSMGGKALNAPAVGMAVAPDGHGYWLVAADGGVFAFGSAGFHGSTGNVHLNAPMVGMAPTPDGLGYWLVAADGGVFAFGTAGFHGSMGSIHLNAPVVGMAATPDGQGYWLVAADGGVFAFGTAAFDGSMGSVRLNAPISGIAATPSGHGYWFVGRDGGVFSFGNAGFFGSRG